MQVQQNKDKLWEAGFIFRGSESPEVRRKSLNKSSELAPANAGLASWQVSGQQELAQFHSFVDRRSRISANLFERIFVPAIFACEVLRLSLWRSGPSLPACRPGQRPVGLLW